jgi:hypothetical protein
MKTLIDCRDTENIHVDTYSMLTGDRYDEYVIECERDAQHNDTLTYDSFDWSYDHAGIVRDLSRASINIVLQAIAHTEYAEIIKDIDYVKSGSPQFYNYTTDWYVMRVSYNSRALGRYIKKHAQAITERAHGYSVITGTGASTESAIDKEHLHHAALCHILDNCISRDDYNYEMWDKEIEIYGENTKYHLVA